MKWKTSGKSIFAQMWWVEHKGHGLFRFERIGPNTYRTEKRDFTATTLRAAKSKCIAIHRKLLADQAAWYKRELEAFDARLGDL